MSENISMTAGEYGKYIARISPASTLGKNMLRAFLMGGVICAVGQVLTELWTLYLRDAELAAGAASVSMIAIGVLLTALGVYDKLAAIGLAGTLVPVTGFANSIAAPAIEFKTEGLVAGMSTKMFTIAGPVLVFGLAASMLYGILLLAAGAGAAGP